MEKYLPVEPASGTWELTQSAWVRLLRWLDEGCDSEGARYLETRRRLEAWFARKGCQAPEMLTDETLNRIARRLEQLGGLTDITPMQYCYTTAKYVWLESLRQPSAVNLSDVNLDDAALSKRTASEPATSESEARYNCLETCLAQLGEAERRLFLRYFTGAERTKIIQRQQLAQELSITANALSLRVFRLRARLESCVGDCLRKAA